MVMIKSHVEGKELIPPQSPDDEVTFISCEPLLSEADFQREITLLTSHINLLRSVIRNLEDFFCSIE